jgi:RNA polymerase sigma factor (sigma-70 family)
MDTPKIKLCIEGNRSAQKELYDSYKHALFVLCQRYFSNIDDAQDALQDGFIKVYRDLYQFDALKGSIYSWLKKVFINTCLEKLRKKKLDFVNVDEAQITSYYEPDVISTLGLKELTELIQSMPTGYRTVFNLYVIEGYNHSEIAQMLGISESTSKTQLMKAKFFLKGKIELVVENGR